VADVALQGIVDRGSGGTPGLAVVGCEAGGLFDGAARDFASGALIIT